MPTAMFEEGRRKKKNRKWIPVFCVDIDRSLGRCGRPKANDLARLRLGMSQMFSSCRVDALLLRLYTRLDGRKGPEVP